ncbi:F-box/LRR-repeat protein 14-like [Mytilus californianus]|uniref:F-box/LRR-repeat protein 14-like n=1 Tax=Mytilus californianus TaxID=6549 RepID=UPI0022458058|nr:F-box/LRR-repeat protein 14-like [Mytilus californianus]
MEINILPPEILLMIFIYLTWEERILAKTVCNLWYKLCRSKSLWRSVNATALHSDTNLCDISSNRHHIRYLKITPILLLKMLQYDDTVKFENLSHLNLAMYDVDSVHIFHLIIERCSNIKMLKFKCCSAQTLNKAINSTKNLLLHELDIIFNGTDAAIPAITKLSECNPKLRKLSINTLSTGLLKYGIHSSKTISSIRANNISLCHKIFLNMPVIHTLSLLHLDSTDIDDDSLLIISKNAPNLNSVSIIGCKSPTEKGILIFTSSCRKLEYFRMGSSYQKLSLYAISRECSALMYIDARSTSISSHVHLQELTASCHCLLSIRLLNVTGLDDLAIEIIADNCTELKDAHFSGSSDITVSGVTYMLIKCRMLTELILKSSYNLRETRNVNRLLRNTSSNKLLPKIKDFKNAHTSNASEPFRNSKQLLTSSKNDSSHRNILLHLEPRVTQLDTESGLISRGKVTTTVTKKDLLNYSPTRHCELRTLNVTSCNNLTPESMVYITKFCPDLRSLICLDCKQFMSVEAKVILHGIFRNCFFIRSISLGKDDTIYSSNYPL